MLLLLLKYASIHLANRIGNVASQYAVLRLFNGFYPRDAFQSNMLSNYNLLFYYTN